MARAIGIDLGTANTLVHMSGRGIIIREPSVVAINKNTNHKNVEFMAKVNVRLEEYEETLDDMKNNVLDMDARVGKLVNNAIKSIANITIGRGGTDEN